MTELLRYRWTSFGPMLDEDGLFVLTRAAEAAKQMSYDRGQRDVFAIHAEWTVPGMCKPDCLPCQRLTELIVERSKGYDEGQREALDAAVKRIKALPRTSETWLAHAERAAIIAAIKGDRP